MNIRDPKSPYYIKPDCDVITDKNCDNNSIDQIDFEEDYLTPEDYDRLAIEAENDRIKPDRD